jgi:ribosomal protein S19
MVGHKLGEFSPTRSLEVMLEQKIKVKNKKQWEFVKEKQQMRERG